MTDFYAVLGISREASARDVKDAYRRRVKEVHPDLNQDDPRSADRVKAVVRAYEVLGNPDRREWYDRTRSARQGLDDSFDYAAFLRARTDDSESQAKLVFYDLLHDNPTEALHVYNALVGTRDVELARYLGREDFMDCAFLLAEEYEERSQFHRAFDLLAAIVAFENEKPYFRHFMHEVYDRLRRLVCQEMPHAYNGEIVLGCIAKMVALGIPRKDEALCYRTAAEVHLRQGNRRRAAHYLGLAMDIDPRITGTTKLRRDLGFFSVT